MLPATIGPYQVQQELGRGGMGEVFLARDTRLDRQVAIKALPAHLAADQVRLARFQREAKMLAALSHPSIGAIYGLEEVGGHYYLILEFIEGETLADVLKRGQIPISEALPLARQIAEALEAAHEKGIIHRDLKPSNVMLTPEGAAKVLDFGLARTEESAPLSSIGSPGSPGVLDSPTLTSPMPLHSPTIPGAIMGTAGYMSPEQARGKPVDKRSDIFSFGCVLYEMLTGIMPFRGETAADAIGATLHKESDLGLLPPHTPRRVRDLLINCLAKDRRQRLHDIGDARLELERAIAEPREAVREVVATRPMWKAALPWTLVTAMLLLGGTFPLWSSRVGIRSSSNPAPAPVVRFSITPPTGYTLPPFIPVGSGIAISPAGDRIVFAAEADNKPYLCVRDVASAESRVLPNTEDCFNPFFSPDGNWLGFISKSRLMKMPADGGPALTICDATNFSSCAWLEDGTIVWGAGASGLWRVSVKGGKPAQLAKAGPGATTVNGDLTIGGFNVPVAVPGANYILTDSWGGFSTEDYNLVAVSLIDGSVRTVLRFATEPRLIAPDRLIFTRGTTVMTVGLDPARGVIVGEPTVALERVVTDMWMDSAYIGASRSGSFAYVPGGRYGADRRLVRVDESGKPTPILETTDTYQTIPVISPDGRKAVFTTLRNKVEMWVLDLERRSMSLVNSKTESFSPAWSVDGASVVAGQTGIDGVASLAKWPVGGGEPTVLPGTSGTYCNPLQELPDGSGLLVESGLLDVTSMPDISLYNYAKGSFTPVRYSPALEADGRVSPDGKWIAYTSDQSGRVEVYLGPLGASGPNVQISTNGGSVPRFSRDGKRISFRDSQDALMAATVEYRGTEPQVSAPMKLFDLKGSGPFAVLRWGGYEVLPDGGFLMIERTAWEREPRAIHVILNWAEELRAKGGTK